MLPFEFTIEGPPVSVQTRRRQRLTNWVHQVRAAAQSRAPVDGVPVDTEITVTITYYYEGDSPDVDNIIKPIQDAMCGVVYGDDAQVVETHSRKRSLDGAFRIRGASPVLLLAFASGNGFLHVLVEEATPEQDLAK